MNLADSGAPILHLVSADGARLTLHRHGGQITSWIPADGRERLFLSARADYRPTAAIRGGIPVIFPQFAGEGPLPKHGFARTARWQLVDPPAVPAPQLALRLRLHDDEATRAIWPETFVADLIVRLAGQRLSVSLAVANTGRRAWCFTAALHSYLAVDAIADVRVHGLNGCRYRDSANGNAICHEQADALAIAGEVDRIYFDVPQTLDLRGPRDALALEQSGFADTVVWNPGPAKAAMLTDLEPAAEQRFLCIEAAAVGRPITLAPGEHWVGTQTLIAG